MGAIRAPGLPTTPTEDDERLAELPVLGLVAAPILIPSALLRPGSAQPFSSGLD